MHPLTDIVPERQLDGASNTRSLSLFGYRRATIRTVQTHARFKFSAAI
jgi:hypothetical protein